MHKVLQNKLESFVLVGGYQLTDTAEADDVRRPHSIIGDYVSELLAPLAYCFIPRVASRLYMFL